MEHHTTPSADSSLAAHAFGELRAEISLLRRAVERLTDERTSQPDYTASLEAISKRLEDVGIWARSISERPLIKLKSDDLERAIGDAAIVSRAKDQQILSEARGAMEAVGKRIDALIVRGRSANEQTRELRTNRIAFALAGMVLWSILPGAVARSLPVSWNVPERVAARMLGSDMWTAGGRMMAKADPEHNIRMVNQPSGQSREGRLQAQGDSFQSDKRCYNKRGRQRKFDMWRRGRNANIVEEER